MMGFLKWTEMGTISIPMKGGWQSPHQCQHQPDSNLILPCTIFNGSFDESVTLLQSQNMNQFVWVKTRDQNKIRHHCSDGEQMTPPDTFRRVNPTSMPTSRTEYLSNAGLPGSSSALHQPHGSVCALWCNDRV